MGTDAAGNRQVIYGRTPQDIIKTLSDMLIGEFVFSDSTGAGTVDRGGRVGVEMSPLNRDVGNSDPSTRF